MGVPSFQACSQATCQQQPRVCRPGHSAPRQKALVVSSIAAPTTARRRCPPRNCRTAAAAAEDDSSLQAISTAAAQQAAAASTDIPDSATSSSTTATSRLLQTDPVQLAELLLRLSQLHVTPHQQWLQEVLDTLAPHLQDLRPPQLASTLQVLGGWGFTPCEAFMQALTGAVVAQLPALTMRDIADMAWGLAQLHNPRQPLLDQLLAAAHDLMQSNSCALVVTAAAHGTTTTTTTSTTATSCTPRADTPSQPGDQQQQQQQQQKVSAPACCPASLADLVWSVAKLQHSPGRAWLDLFVATSRPLLGLCEPPQLAQMAWAFARLRVEGGQPYAPGQAWLDALLASISTRLQDFDAKSVSLMAWGLATLKVRPSARWLFAFERQAERTLSSLAAAELACTLWALSELKSKRAHELRLGRLVRRQEVFWGFDFEALANPRLLRVVRQLTLGPQRGGSKGV